MGRQVLLAAAVVVAAVVGVVTEYATATSPAWLSAWLSADPWRPWLLLGVAVLLAAVLAMLAVQEPSRSQARARRCRLGSR